MFLHNILCLMVCFNVLPDAILLCASFVMLWHVFCAMLYFAISCCVILCYVLLCNVYIIMTSRLYYHGRSLIGLDHTEMKENMQSLRNRKSPHHNIQVATIEQYVCIYLLKFLNKMKLEINSFEEIILDFLARKTCFGYLEQLMMDKVSEACFAN